MTEQKSYTCIPGSYPAKIIDYGIWKGAKGPQAVVMFEYRMADGQVKNITWFGSFNGGAREFTVESLVRMGFTGKNGAELNGGKGSNVLNESMEFEIVIDNETYQGKTNARVKFINLPGGSDRFRQKMAERGEAAVLMGGLNLEADFMAARQKTKPQGSTAPAMQQPAFTENDIPF